MGQPLETDPSLEAVVLRYLAAFGPASVAEVTTWCRLTGLRQVVELAISFQLEMSSTQKANIGT